MLAADGEPCIILWIFLINDEKLLSLISEVWRSPDTRAFQSILPWQHVKLRWYDSGLDWSQIRGSRTGMAWFCRTLVFWPWVSPGLINGLGKMQMSSQSSHIQPVLPTSFLTSTKRGWKQIYPKLTYERPAFWIQLCHSRRQWFCSYKFTFLRCN